jgi:hypothetical protein
VAEPKMLPWGRGERVPGVVCGRVATLFLALAWAHEGSARGRVVRSGVVYPLRGRVGGLSRDARSVRCRRPVLR